MMISQGPSHSSTALLTTLLLACAEPADHDPSSQGGAPPAEAGGGGDGGGGGGGDPTGQGLVGEARRLLEGDFDSSDQAEEDPSYFPIRLQMCRVTVSQLGNEALYVEQAVMDPPSEPYRQRVYVIEAEGGEGVVSRVFELDDPEAWVGACGDRSVRTIELSSLLERDGCAVHLASTGPLQLEGGTVGDACESSLQGASYATSEVTLSVEGLTSWDRGFDVDGAQVWGAVDGPYRFARRTPLSEE